MARYQISNYYYSSYQIINNIPPKCLILLTILMYLSSPWASFFSEYYKSQFGLSHSGVGPTITTQRAPCWIHTEISTRWAD